jgi:hypothetical protein
MIRAYLYCIVISIRGIARGKQEPAIQRQRSAQKCFHGPFITFTVQQQQQQQQRQQPPTTTTNHHQHNSNNRYYYRAMPRRKRRDTAYRRKYARHKKTGDLPLNAVPRKPYHKKVQQIRAPVTKVQRVRVPVRKGLRRAVSQPEECTPFDARKLRKKYTVIDGEMAQIWDARADDIANMSTWKPAV